MSLGKFENVRCEDWDVRGFGSVRREERESMTLNKDSAGDQLFFRISIQILPWSEIWQNVSSLVIIWWVGGSHSCGIFYRPVSSHFVTSGRE